MSSVLQVTSVIVVLLGLFAFIYFNQEVTVQTTVKCSNQWEHLETRVFYPKKFSPAELIKLLSDAKVKFPRDVATRTDTYLLTTNSNVNVKLRKDKNLEVKLMTRKVQKYPHVESWQKVGFGDVPDVRENLKSIMNSCSFTKNKVDQVWAEVKVVKQVVKTNLRVESNSKDKFTEKLNACIKRKKMSLIAQSIDVEVGLVEIFVHSKDSKVEQSLGAYQTISAESMESGGMLQCFMEEIGKYLPDSYVMGYPKFLSEIVEKNRYTIE